MSVRGERRAALRALATERRAKELAEQRETSSHTAPLSWPRFGAKTHRVRSR